MPNPTFSVFTPTHRPNYLSDAYRSLCEQTRKDWEWVLVPNGPKAYIPDALRKDPRVRVIPADQETTKAGIGALKRFACHNGRGRMLVELDHDDRLTPNALERLHVAHAETGAGFLYSDFLNINSAERASNYSESYGWETYDVPFAGKSLRAMRAFPPTPAALHQIFYAPNHVRAWMTDAYMATGGHDATMPVCDDHDLICRTYLAGIKFSHVPECLYIYRLQPNGENTSIERNAEIQKAQQGVSNKYIYHLIYEWCRQQGLQMLSLGGAVAPDGFTVVNRERADIICDPMERLPCEDNSVGCVRAYSWLHHVPQCSVYCRHERCTLRVMNEIYRVLVPGGWAIFQVPSAEDRGAAQDPRTASWWVPNTFWYFSNREFARAIPEINCRFQRTRLWGEYATPQHAAQKVQYIYADLVALKGQRQPGLIEI